MSLSSSISGLKQQKGQMILEILLALILSVHAQRGKCYQSNRAPPQTHNPPPPKPEPVAPKPVTVPKPQPDDQSDYGLSPFSVDCLSLHNSARLAMGIPALTWSAELENSAKSWAITTSRSGFRHSGTPGVGENLYSGSGGSCIAAVTAWLSEAAKVSNPGAAISAALNGVVGHYTQVMWKGTTHLGCGSSGNDVVCQYSPAGNVISQKPY